MHVSSLLHQSNVTTYAENLDLNRPYVWLAWCQAVLGIFVGFLYVDAHAEHCVSLHVHLLCLQQLQLLEGNVVGDAGREPSVAHGGRVEGNI